MKPQIYGTLGLTAVLAAFSFAGVRMESDTGGQAMGMKMAGTTTTWVEGPRMRVDHKQSNGDTTVIIDAESMKMININHAKREADVIDMRSVADQVRKIASSDVKVELTATGEKKEIAGISAEKHNLLVRVNSSPVPGQDLDVVLEGFAWVAPEAPGMEDYKTFYRLAAEKGLFFHDPKVAREQTGHARGMAELYAKLADAGMPLATEIKVRFDGKGLLAGMLNKMGGGTITSTATKVEGQDVGGDSFAMPSGYKVNNR